MKMAGSRNQQRNVNKDALYLEVCSVRMLTLTFGFFINPIRFIVIYYMWSKVLSGRSCGYLLQHRLHVFFWDSYYGMWSPLLRSLLNMPTWFWQLFSVLHWDILVGEGEYILYLQIVCELRSSLTNQFTPLKNGWK